MKKMKEEQIKHIEDKLKEIERLLNERDEMVKSWE